MDKYGKDKIFYPVAAAGVVGGILVYLIKFVNNNMTWVYILFITGGTLVESASLLAAGLFNATARDYTPAEKAGCFQGVRIIIFVTLPMIIASIFCPLIINAFGPIVEQFGVSPGNGYFPIPDGSGYKLPFIDPNTGAEVVSHVYPFELFLFAAIVAALMFIPTYFVHRENKKFRAEKLKEINADTKVVGDVTPDVAETDGSAQQVEADKADESAE